MPNSTPSPQRELLARIIARDSVRSEATLQADIRQLLLSPELNLEERQVVDLEVPLADGTRRRIDIEAGNAVIEVKRDLRKGNVLSDAVGQLAGYLRHRSLELGRRYVGILTDGRDWYLYNLTEDRDALTEASRITVDEDDSERLLIWLETILATVDHITPSPEEIERRLGVDSAAYQLDHQQLRQIYDSVEGDPEVRLKRRLWARLLRTAFGSHFSDDARLFIDHSLLVLQANIIAHAVIGLDLIEAENDPVKLISGAQFTEAEINNVVEADFFDWVLRSEHGAGFVSNLVHQLRRFSWNNVEHDVLKVLYESIINVTTRKRLGEYYTPDWLAERMVAEVITDPLRQRVLDPSCGSGTFIFHAVRHHLAAAEAAGLSNADALTSVEHKVFGMDIHPVSVVLARVTYLLAIGSDRLRARRGSVSVPVYLGDSVQWARNASTVDDTMMRIEVDAQDLAGQENQSALFSIGRVLAFPLTNVDDPAIFDRLVSDLAAEAQKFTTPHGRKPPMAHLLDQYGISDPGNRATLKQTFEVLCDLNAGGENHIWGYFVRNQVRPLWFALESRHVDVLIGNPPWVAFKFMTEAMQLQFKRFCQVRNLWTGGNVTVTQDLVGLFIARTVEQYLGVGGKFAFVTPKAVLSRTQYEGFRSGKWGTALVSTAGKANVSVRAAFTSAWDTGDVRPAMFPVPSAVVFGERSERESPLMSVTNKFTGKLPARSVRLSVAIKSLTEAGGSAHQQTSGVSHESPYASTAFQGAIFSPRLIFFVKERSTGPLGSSHGIVPIESHRTSLEHEPYKSLPTQTGTIERVFLRDVVMGGTLAHYRILEPWCAVLPVSGSKLLGEEDIKLHRHLNSWWTQGRDLWESNKKPNSRLTLMDQLDYQGKLSRQLGKGMHRVVYVASGTTMAAAYVSNPDLIIDNSLYWMVVQDAATARYLAAILNSSVLLARIRPLQSEGLFGPRHFHRLPWRLPIPIFNDNLRDHHRLAELGRVAEEVAAKVTPPQGASFRTVRKSIRERLNEEGISQQIESYVASLLS